MASTNSAQVVANKIRNTAPITTPAMPPEVRWPLVVRSEEARTTTVGARVDGLEVGTARGLAEGTARGRTLGAPLGTEEG